MVVADPMGWLLPVGVLGAIVVVVSTLLTVRRRPWIALVIALAAVAAGVATALGAFGPLSIGWWAYAPLSDSTFLPIGFWFVRPGALVLAGSGLVGIGVVVGAALLRRPTPATDGTAAGAGGGDEG